MGSSKRIPTYSLLVPIFALMNNYFVAKSMTSNGDGTYTLLACNTKWITLKSTITFGDVDYTVIDFMPHESITIKGPSAPTELTANLTIPHFYHGTILAKSAELDSILNSADKLPFGFLREVMREVFYDDPMDNRDRESDCDLYFMTDYNPEDWVIADHDRYAIAPMRAFMDEFISAVENSYRFRPIITMEVYDRQKWGSELNGLGNSKKLFNEFISGVQLRITLPFLKDINCTYDCDYVRPTPPPEPCDGILDIDIAVSDTQIVQGSIIEFNAIIIAGGTADVYAWEFEGGTPHYNRTSGASVTYNTIGTFYVTLFAANSLNGKVGFIKKSAFITVTMPVYCPEATALFTRMDGLGETPSDSDKTAINTLLAGIKSDQGLDFNTNLLSAQLLDLMVVAAMNGLGTMKLNTVQDAYNSQWINSPIATVNKGVTGIGNAYIKTNYTISANAVNFQRDNGVMFLYINQSNTNTGYLMGTSQSNASNLVRNNGTSLLGNLFDSNLDETGFLCDPTGLFVLKRISLTQTEFWHNGILLGVRNSAAGTKLNFNIEQLVLAINTGSAGFFSNSTVALYGYGSGNLLIPEFYNRVQTYLTYKAAQA